MGRILLSICAVVVAMGLGALQQANQPSSAGSGQATSGAQVVPLIVTPPQRGPDIEDPGCESSQDNRRSDLCAQWKAADAARSSANAAWWLGIVGLMIGGFTLWAAIRAAHWAKEAATHTQSGALASDRAANAAVSQQRPWAKIELHAVSISILDETVTFKVRYVVKNVGSTPAIIDPIIKVQPFVAELSGDTVGCAKEALKSLEGRPPWQNAPEGMAGVPLWPGEPLAKELNCSTQIVRGRLNPFTQEPFEIAEGALFVCVAISVHYKFNGGEGVTSYVYEAQPIDARDVLDENGDERLLRFRELHWLTSVS